MKHNMDFIIKPHVIYNLYNRYRLNMQVPPDDWTDEFISNVEDAMEDFLLKNMPYVVEEEY